MKSIIAENFNLIAGSYDNTAVLHQEIGRRLLEHLNLIKFIPDIVLDLGCGTGYHSSNLASRYPKATLFNFDISQKMLEIASRSSQYPNALFVCADGESLPIKSNSVDLVFSNTLLQYFFYPQKVLEAIYQVLKPEGILLFSTFGPNTLKELCKTFEMLNQEYPIQSFQDMHDIGDLLLKLGFVDPVMDMETITLSYGSLAKLAEDLLHTECHTIQITESLLQAYERFRTAEGVLPATFEIIYGVAFSPKRKELYRQDKNGVVHIPADQIPIL